MQHGVPPVKLSIMLRVSMMFSRMCFFLIKDHFSMITLMIYLLNYVLQGILATLSAPIAIFINQITTLTRRMIINQSHVQG